MRFVSSSYIFGKGHHLSVLLARAHAQDRQEAVVQGHDLYNNIHVCKILQSQQRKLYPILRSLM